MKNILIVFLLGVTSYITAQHKEIPLWEIVPNAIENRDYKEEFRLDSNGKATGIKKVSVPTLEIFLAKNANEKTPGVVICPGGAYSLLSHIKEGSAIAQWLNSIGISAFVLKYRLPSDAIMKDKTIGPLQDAQEAIRTLRRNANQWNLDENKIGIIGFSAGGHLASTVSTHYNDKVYENDEFSARPDFTMLIYPVISMEDAIAHKVSRENLLGKNPSKDLIEKFSNEKQVNKETPPTFLVHATNDVSVPVENSINYYLALKKNNVSAEMHIYESGGHGLSLGKSGTNLNWPKSCEDWLIANKVIHSSN